MCSCCIFTVKSARKGVARHGQATYKGGRPRPRPPAKGLSAAAWTACSQVMASPQGRSLAGTPAGVAPMKEPPAGAVSAAKAVTPTPWQGGCRRARVSQHKFQRKV
ncbi:hypothetical protein BHE74_00008617 [Ensete ventricosum]|nr:hypothetical protein BHE74_00008617 [Ensete ventricosum]